MSHNTIKIEELEFPIKIEKELAGSYGEGSHKTLFLQTILFNDGQVSSGFIVRTPEVESVFNNLLLAVEHYNMIP